MRKLWAKLLAGEIKQPGAHSVRTLDVLRNLTREEARLLERVAAYVNGDAIYKLGSLGTTAEDARLTFSDVLSLVDAGLLNAGTNIERKHAAGAASHLVFSDVVLQLLGTTPLGLPIFKLTPAGTDMARLLAIPADQLYVRELAQVFCRATWKVTLHARRGPRGYEPDGEEIVLPPS